MSRKLPLGRKGHRGRQHTQRLTRCCGMKWRETLSSQPWNLRRYTPICWERCQCEQFSTPFRKNSNCHDVLIFKIVSLLMSWRSSTSIFIGGMDTGDKKTGAWLCSVTKVPSKRFKNERLACHLPGDDKFDDKYMMKCKVSTRCDTMGQFQ